MIKYYKVIQDLSQWRQDGLDLFMTSKLSEVFQFQTQNNNLSFQEEFTNYQQNEQTQIANHPHPQTTTSISVSFFLLRFQIQSGTYFLLSQDGTKKPVKRNGSARPKFIQNFSGFATARERYSVGKQMEHVLPIVPDLTFHHQNSFYTPSTSKFVGFSQFPFQKLNKSIPNFLLSSNKPKTTQRKVRNSVQKHSSNKGILNESLILNKTEISINKQNFTQQFFQISFSSIAQSKPLPSKMKKTCYNQRCSKLKDFTNHKSIVKSIKMSSNQSISSQNLTKHYFDKQFEQQKLQLFLISNMK